MFAVLLAIVIGAKQYNSNRTKINTANEVYIDSMLKQKVK